MIGQPPNVLGSAPLPTGVNETPLVSKKDVKVLPHYMMQGIQPIRFFQSSMTADEFKGFLKGNIIKYVMRERNKNGAEDIAKAKVYMDWLDEFTRTGDITVPGEKNEGAS